MNFLFVDDQLDDDSSSASVAARKLEEIGEFSIACANFSNAEQKIDQIAPNLVILDLQERDASGESSFAGNITCEWIWKNHFCPIVVYSAFPDQLPEVYRSHPFVEVVKKGSKGVEELKSSIANLRPHIESIQEAEKNIRKEFSFAMREVAPYAFDNFKDDPLQLNETIKRSGRRRLAALMDELPQDGTKLASWEQYLFPPVSQDIQLGDILKKDGGGSDDPASFCVVLTPSCDLVATGGRVPKVDKVLVAGCCFMDDGLKCTSWPNITTPNLKKRLKDSVLSRGYFESIIPFPALAGQIPTMVANLNDLEFIPIANIGFSDVSFIRIASVDSPFRELISWAYLQVACRPGLPDRNFESWKDEIVDSVKKSRGEN